MDETGEDDFTLTGGEADATDDAAPPEPAAARRTFFPSSIGLSLLVPGATSRLRVIVNWGDYRAEPRDQTPHRNITAPTAQDAVFSLEARTAA